VSPRTLFLGVPASVTLQGEHFRDESVVYWDGRRKPTVRQSSSRLRVALTESDVAVEGPHSVEVYTEMTGGGLHLAGELTVDVDVKEPVLRSITPDHAFVPPTHTRDLVTKPTAAGSASMVPEPTTSNSAVTAVGEYFNHTSRLAFCDDPCTIGWRRIEPSRLTATELTGAIPQGLLRGAGAFQIAVHNIPNNNAALQSESLPFEVRHRRPVIDSLFPSFDPLNPPREVTVLGQHFTPASVVHWNGVPVPTRYEWTNRYFNSEVLRAPVDVVEPDSTARFRLTVVTPGPGGGESEPLEFVLPWGAPEVRSASPSALVVGEPSTTTLRIFGRYFSTRSFVLWNGESRPYEYRSAGEMLITVSPSDQAVAGTGYVTVVEPLTADTSNALAVPIR